MLCAGFYLRFEAALRHIKHLSYLLRVLLEAKGEVKVDYLEVINFAIGIFLASCFDSDIFYANVSMDNFPLMQFL